MSALQPLRNNIIFEFLDDTRQSDGKFSERTTGNIIVATPQKATQSGTPRWGKVLSYGPSTVQGIAVGDFILIEAGKWTVGTEFEGKKIWMTDDEWVMMVTDDVKETYNF